ncbi:MAG: DUF4347 domain-containing protein, partial [Oscillatoriales cyanobacterium]
MEFDKTRNQQIVFVDSQVKDYPILTESIHPDTKVIVLKGDRDGIEQIAETLKQGKNIAAVHILSHGAAASVQIGATELNLSNIETYRDRLETWFALPAEENSNSRITAKPEILLYGCNVAATEAGVAFVQRLSDITGAEVAASDNLTGNAALGGDWELEVTTGKIETAVAFSQEAREAYSGVLADLQQKVANFNELVNAINVANTNTGIDTITLTGNITLTGLLPRIFDTTTIVGAGFKISGNNNRAFVVDNTTFNISNLTIDSAKAVGNPGTTGGGGAAGLGGALFINGGTVIVDKVTFSSNQAVGGAGAAGNGGNGGNADLATVFGGTAGTNGRDGRTGLASNGLAGGVGEAGEAGGAGTAGGTGGKGGTGGTGGIGTNGGAGGIGGAGGAGSVVGSGGGGGGAGGVGGAAGTGTQGSGGNGGAGGAGTFGGGGGAGGAFGTGVA